MIQGVSFARACSDHYAMITGSSMWGKRILDFGCGYGRFLRIFSYYSDEVFGVDPWDNSLDFCRQAGLGDRVGKTEVILDKIPHPGRFDFISAFSVFTHLSERAATAALRSLRACATDGAIFALTIRPPRFWEFAANGSLKTRADEARSMLLKHNMNGFAFLPHLQSNGIMLDHYGDTTISFDWFDKNSLGWQVRATDGSFDDPYQRYVFLQAV
jgi:SAM-dependent methyltransferase